MPTQCGVVLGKLGENVMSSPFFPAMDMNREWDSQSNSVARRYSGKLKLNAQCQVARFSIFQAIAPGGKSTNNALFGANDAIFS